MRILQGRLWLRWGRAGRGGRLCLRRMWEQCLLGRGERSLGQGLGPTGGPRMSSLSLQRG